MRPLLPPLREAPPMLASLNRLPQPNHHSTHTRLPLLPLLFHHAGNLESLLSRMRLLFNNNYSLMRRHLAEFWNGR